MHQKAAINADGFIDMLSKPELLTERLCGRYPKFQREINVGFTEVPGQLLTNGQRRIMRTLMIPKPGEVICRHGHGGESSTCCDHHSEKTRIRRVLLAYVVPLTTRKSRHSI